MEINHNRKLIYIVGFLLSIPIALSSYINSTFLEGYVGKYNVGILYVISSIITILGLLKMPKILTRFGNRITTLISGSFLLLSFVMLAYGKSVLVLVPGFVMYFVFINLIFLSLDIFVEDFSKDNNVGSLRGLYLVVVNFAWVIGEFLSGPIMKNGSFPDIYTFGVGFVAVTLVLFILFLRDFKDPLYVKEPIRKTISLFWKDKNLSGIYLINLILKFFYAWMVIYTPMYLNEYLGIGWDKIGIIFSIMLIPFIIVEFPLGMLSDRIGEKKMLLLGFLIAAFSTLIMPFIQTPGIYIWASVLFVTRIGAAMIEVMSESYFFKAVNEESADKIDFFRNTTPLSYIIAPLVAMPILFFSPSFEYLFVVLSAILLLGFLITLRIKDIKN